MKCDGIIDGLLPKLDKILGIRDKIGADLVRVFIVERCWSGEQPGEGRFTDSETCLVPTPYIRDFSQDIRLQPNAGVQQGDIILKNISKNSFTEDDLETRTDERNIEKFYRIETKQGEKKFYHVVNIKEDYLVFDVQIRRIAAEDILSGDRLPVR